MTLVMTLLARDEIDIVDSWLAFHLNAGVDFVDRDRQPLAGRHDRGARASTRAPGTSTSSASRARTCARTSG